MRAGMLHSVGSPDDDYLRLASSGDFTAQDFRAWQGSAHALALATSRRRALQQRGRQDSAGRTRALARQHGCAHAGGRRAARTTAHSAARGHRTEAALASGRRRGGCVQASYDIERIAVAGNRPTAPRKILLHMDDVPPRMLSFGSFCSTSEGIGMTSKSATNQAQLHELLYQALETESGGIAIYTTALTCALNEDLRKEWNEYLAQTRHHHDVLSALCTELGLDPAQQTPGREVVGHIGKSLVRAMEMAKQSGPPEAAELVACECVVLAETKDHANWDLIGHAADRLKGATAKALQAAHGEVAKDEQHHLFHTKGFCRELWIQSLGFPAVLPPPEEVKEVETAIGASRAEQGRGEMLKGRH